jgi:membrane associated rhomboid family serine protease
MIPIKDNVPTETFPWVTIALILVNVVVYILSVRHGGSLISGPDAQEVLKFGAIPRALTHSGVHCADVARQTVAGPQPLGVICNSQLLSESAIAPQNSLPAWQTALTSMFMHGSIVHIAGNMLFLWIFGNNVEDALGHLKFVGFYLLGGIAALALQVLVAPNSTAPTIGASGAIAAVLGAYIVLYPRARVLTFVFIILFFTVIELPAIVMLGIWFAEQAVFGAAGLTNPTGGGGGVAYFAHVGGFVFGALAIRLLVSKRQRGSSPVPAY